jgi:SAM-dependent methyltransferase
MQRFQQFHLGKLATPFQWLYSLPRIFFGMFYHGLAGMYDGVTSLISMGLWKEWLATTLPYLDGPKILELGPGPGHLQKMLNQNGNLVFGLEESHQMILQARRHLHKNGHTFHLIRAIGQDIPFQKGVFDQIVSTFPAEFITHPHTLSEIRRVLKPQGELVILRFAWLSDRRWPYKATAWLFRLVGEAPIDGLPEERLIAPFQEAGFQVHIEQLDLESSGVLLLCCKQGVDRVPFLSVRKPESVSLD